MHLVKTSISIMRRHLQNRSSNVSSLWLFFLSTSTIAWIIKIFLFPSFITPEASLMLSFEPQIKWRLQLSLLIPISVAFFFLSVLRISKISESRVEATLSWKSVLIHPSFNLFHIDDPLSLWQLFTPRVLNMDCVKYDASVFSFSWLCNWYK